MSKVLLPVLVGVFVGAFTVELVRRNNPELVSSVQRKAKRLARSVNRALSRSRRQLTGFGEGSPKWKHSGLSR